MNVGTLLDEIRAQYLTEFLAALSEAESNPDCTVVAESELVDAAGELVTEGLLDVGVRTDIVVISPDGTRSLRVDSTRAISFAPVDFRWATGLSVRLQPLSLGLLRAERFPFPAICEGPSTRQVVSPLVRASRDARVYSGRAAFHLRS